MSFLSSIHEIYAKGVTRVPLCFHSNTPLEYVSLFTKVIALLINIIFTAITIQFYNKQLAKYAMVIYWYTIVHYDCQ